jgi:hypothetical protein
VRSIRFPVFEVFVATVTLFAATVLHAAPPKSAGSSDPKAPKVRPAGAQADPARPEHKEFVVDPLSVTRQGPAWRYPQAGWHVVHVEGSPYERGYQHGRLLAPEIADYVESIAEIRSPKSPHQAWRDLRVLVNSLFLRRFDGEYLEEMKGIADGAAAAGAKFGGRRLDFIDVACINCDIEVSYLDPGLHASATGLDKRKFAHPQYSEPEAHAPERCSAFAATGPATADGKIVIGHITMSGIDYVRHYNVWLDIQPAEGRRVVMQTFPGGIWSGFDYYLNDGGLIVAETTIHQTKFNPEGRPLASRVRRAVQYADSIDKAVEILGEASNGLYTNQWLLADTKTDEIAMFELGTERNRLWRSSRNEWFGGTKGFYWGCNNIRDLDVLKETVPDLGGKPANLVRFPRTRDKAWLAIFEKYSGNIAEPFAFEAFTTPPLAAFPSCDAKFTTSKLAGKLESWALFGPPRGQTWDPTSHDRKKYPAVKSLVGNDWTLLGVAPPPSKSARDEKPVDLEPFARQEDDPPVKFDAHHPFAWRGTLLPKTAADIWLAAAFAEYEHVVALENALLHEQEKSSKDRARDAGPAPLNPQSRDLAELALFAHESGWLTAARRLGRDVPLRETKPDPAKSEWYQIAKGKGVMLLAALRGRLGKETFDSLMDEFGQAHAGREVSTSQFIEHVTKAAGKPASEVFDAWLGETSPSTDADDNPWTIHSFEAEPEQALIVYGTLADVSAQREAAEILQRTIARRFSNLLIPIASDEDVDDKGLGRSHVILVGRPATNGAAARCAARLPVQFGQSSFTVREKTYAHPNSAVIAAGDNPFNSRYSAVIYAGLGAYSTWNCVHPQEEDDLPAAQVVVLADGQKTTRLRVATKAANVPERRER